MTGEDPHMNPFSEAHQAFRTSVRRYSEDLHQVPNGEVLKITGSMVVWSILNTVKFSTELLKHVEGWLNNHPE